MSAVNPQSSQEDNDLSAIAAFDFADSVGRGAPDERITTAISCCERCIQSDYLFSGIGTFTLQYATRMRSVLLTYASRRRGPGV